jgi:hypothetical protein
MRAFHAIIIPILLFSFYLFGNFILNPQYANASVSDFFLDNIKSIFWSSAVFCLGITFDFIRRATDGGKCKEVHGNFFLWVITVALFFQLVLASGEAVMVVSGAQTLIAVMSGYEAIILILVYGSSTFNSIAYAIGVDANS